MDDDEGCRPLISHMRAMCEAYKRKEITAEDLFNTCDETIEKRRKITVISAGKIDWEVVQEAFELKTDPFPHSRDWKSPPPRVISTHYFCESEFS